MEKTLTRPRKISSQPRRKAKTLSFSVEKQNPLQLLDVVGKFPSSKDIVAMKVNGVPHNLNSRVKSACACSVKLTPIYANSIGGEAVLRRSYVFLMGKAIYEVEKNERKWHCEHQLANAYFCQFEDSKEPSEEFLKKVKDKMIEISKRRVAISEDKIYHADALHYFEKMNMGYSAKLLETLNQYEVRMNICEEYMTLGHRVLAHNTSLLNVFDLKKRAHGWSLEFLFAESRFGLYYQAKEMDHERVIGINHERNQFASSIGVECVGDINKLVTENRVEQFISLNNTFQDMVMNSLVKRIDSARKERQCRLVLIAGPSASGKTTFAKKVSWNLLCKGYKCYTLSVDNYYVPREQNPKDEEGNYDFECLEALRISKLNQDIQDLFDGKEIWTPKFDMKTGTPNDKGKKMKIEQNSFLIMEGIHCLNDRLTPAIDPNLKFKIFIAPFTPINTDDVNYISNKIIRLIRRAVRDKMHRGHSISQTMKMWPSVLKGENYYIFPFMNGANFIFNSALDYEINVLKPYVKPLLKEVKPTDEFFDTARDLLEFLAMFEVIPYKYVPQDSLLQEFIDGHWTN